MAELKEGVRHDLEYAEHWSSAVRLLDCMLTVLRLFNERDAY